MKNGKRKKWFALLALPLAVACLFGCAPKSDGAEGEEEEDYLDWGETYDYFYYEEYYHATDDMSFVEFKSSRGVHLYEAERAEGWFSANKDEYEQGAAHVGYSNGCSKTWRRKNETNELRSRDEARGNVDGNIVDYFGNGEWLTFRISSQSACTALVVLNIATANSDDQWEPFGGAEAKDVLVVTHNEVEDENHNPVGSGNSYSEGSVIDSSTCYVDSTGGWTSFSEIYVGEVPLVAGENVIRVYAKMSFNVDYLALAPKISEIERNTISYSGETMVVECVATNGKISSCIEDDCPWLGDGHRVLGLATDSTAVEFRITCDRAYSFVELRLKASFGPIGGANATDDEGYMWLYNRIGVTVNKKDIDVDPGYYPEEDADGNPVAKFNRKAITIASGNWWESYQEYLLGNIDLHAGENIIVISSAGYAEFNLDYIKLGIRA